MTGDIKDRLRLLGAIMRESQGIAGYHLNGDIEPWGNLEPTPDEAADALAALETERDKLREALALMLPEARKLGWHFMSDERRQAYEAGVAAMEEKA